MLGIIVLNFNNPNETINCINSIQISSLIKYKIYIVDNSEDLNSFNQLNSTYKSNSIIKIIKSENNGYSAGNNLGIKMAIKEFCDLLLIVNPDVEFYKNSIDLLVSYINSDETVAVVGPSVFNTDLTLQNNAKRILTFKRYISNKKLFKKFLYRTYKDYRVANCSNSNLGVIKFEGMVSGCCFLIKSNVFEKIGLFDENSFLFYEEDIIGIKLNRLGLKTAVLCSSKVIHKGGSATGNKPSAFVDFHRFRSGFYVLKKYVKLNFFQSLVVIIIDFGIYLFRSFLNSNYNKRVVNLLNYYLSLTFKKK